MNILHPPLFTLVLFLPIHPAPRRISETATRPATWPALLPTAAVLGFVCYTRATKPVNVVWLARFALMMSFTGEHFAHFDPRISWTCPAPSGMDTDYCNVCG